MKTTKTVAMQSVLWGLVLGWSSLQAAGAVLRVPTQHPAIQGAVNAAASGDEIQIAAGVYQEQILIVGKNLTLVGEPGAVIQAKTGLSPILAPYDGICATPLFGIALSSVVLRGLTFDGARLVEAYPNCGLVGVFFDGSSGRIEGCTVKGFRRAADLGYFAGHGLVAVNGVSLGRPVQQVELVHNRFEDNSGAIFVLGDFGASTSLRLRFSIRDNTIIGSGPTDTGRQFGLLIAAGATGEVTGNHISDHIFTGQGPVRSWGVVAMDWWAYLGNRAPIVLQPVRYETNTFVNNQQGLASILSSGSQIVSNWFQGTGQGHFDCGLFVSGANVQVSGNHLSNLGRGVTLLGEDPDFPNLRLGIAVNPRLDKNDFCDVVTPVQIEPTVTGVQESGTVLCPPPSLAFGPGASLVWPAERFGWALETATDPLGPWQPFSTPGTQHVANVELVGDRQFFRLRQP